MQAPFTSRLGPYGEGHTMGLTPQDFLSLEEHLADEGAAIGVHLDKHGAAEAVMCAHHIAAVDESGLAHHPVVMKAQGVEHPDAVHISAMLETLVAVEGAVMPAIMPAMIPGIRRGGAQADSRNNCQRRCRQK